MFPGFILSHSDDVGGGTGLPSFQHLASGAGLLVTTHPTDPANQFNIVAFTINRHRPA